MGLKSTNNAMLIFTIMIICGVVFSSLPCVAARNHKHDPICPACVCCTPAPKGQCCSCCASPVEVQSSPTETATTP
ncbi:Protein amnionless [Bienertia sinuspersici]